MISDQDDVPGRIVLTKYFEYLYQHNGNEAG
jgi:hypothetical protein